VPQDVLAEFLQVVERTPEYQWYSVLPADRMKEQLAKWQEEFGYRLRPETYCLWRLFLSRQPFQLADGATAYLFHENRGGHPVVVLNVLGRHKEGFVSVADKYVLRETDLSPLNGEVLLYLSVMDPLSTPVERFAAQNEPLSTLFSRLCTMGDASCSYRQDLADKMRITLDVRGKTVLRCLTVLAKTAGGQALLVGRGYGEPTPLEKVEPNYRIRCEDLRTKYAEAAATQPASQPDPVEILRKTVQSQVEDQRKDRPVIILQLPAASE
jgi:hypothetical protein